MLFTPEIVDEIVSCAHWADRLVRADLIDGVVVSENDYTSNFTSALRRELNARMIPGLRAKIQVLNPSAERELGADACVILQNKSLLKVAIFEAKWPRLSTHVDAWDSKQKSSRKSHFHSQLERQNRLRHYAGIWEMFYCEFPFGKQPRYMPDEGSACVWHEHAYKASNKRLDPTEPWTDADLRMLLEVYCTSIAEVFRSLCMCSQGKPLPIGDYSAAFGKQNVPHEALVISYTPEEGDI